MYQSHDPRWLRFLARKAPWLAIPNLAMVLVGLQGLGFLLVFQDPEAIRKIALVPGLVLQGEVWRVLSFLLSPMTMSPIGMIFALMFLYYVMNLVESEWGEFKTTLYVLVSVVLTVIFSFAFDYPVASISGFVSTLFLAAATLFPENEIRLYLMIPVKLKWLGVIAAGFVALQFFRDSWTDRAYLLTLYANYFLFFGPVLAERVKQWKRRRDFKSNWR